MRTLIDKILENGIAQASRQPCGCQHSADRRQSYQTALWDEEISVSPNLGRERTVIQTAIVAGNRNENRLSDIIFFRRHPERNGRLIQKNEPDFRALSQEWLDIRGNLVRPLLARDRTKVRRFTCDKDDLKLLLENVDNVGNLTVTDLKVRLEEAAKEAVFWALRSAYELRRSPRSSSTKSAFGEVFGYCPEHLPEYWKKKQRKWRDFGELAALRLESAARIISSGDINYFCWNGRKHCKPVPGFTQCALSTNHYACFGKNSSICLGKHFWELWTNDNDLAGMAITVMHEALHIYFHFMGHPAPPNNFARIANISCYQSFVAKLNNLRLSAGRRSSIEAFCSSTGFQCA